LRRQFADPKPTPVPLNFQPAELVDTGVLDYQKMAQLLRTVGIVPLGGETIGSPMQRLHISSEIGQLNRFMIPGIPNLSNLEDIAQLSAPQRGKLFRAKTGEVPPARRASRPVEVDIEEEIEEEARSKRVRESAADVIKKASRRSKQREADRILGRTGPQAGEQLGLFGSSSDPSPLKTRTGKQAGLKKP
jgi:hypothetical protein